MVYHQWPVGQAVKTSPSHGENSGSIPLWVTIADANIASVFLCIKTSRMSVKTLSSEQQTLRMCRLVPARLDVWLVAKD